MPFKYQCNVCPVRGRKEGFYGTNDCSNWRKHKTKVSHLRRISEAGQTMPTQQAPTTPDPTELESLKKTVGELKEELEIWKQKVIDLQDRPTVQLPSMPEERDLVDALMRLRPSRPLNKTVVEEISKTFPCPENVCICTQFEEKEGIERYIVPHNLSNTHWIVVVYDKDKKYIVDSLNQDDGRLQLFPNDTLATERIVVPPQTENCDSGVFVLKYIEALSRLNANQIPTTNTFEEIRQEHTNVYRDNFRHHFLERQHEGPLLEGKDESGAVKVYVSGRLQPTVHELNVFRMAFPGMNFTRLPTDPETPGNTLSLVLKVRDPFLSEEAGEQFDEHNAPVRFKVYSTEKNAPTSLVEAFSKDWLVETLNPPPTEEVGPPEQVIVPRKRRTAPNTPGGGRVSKKPRIQKNTKVSIRYKMNNGSYEFFSGVILGKKGKKHRVRFGDGTEDSVLLPSNQEGNTWNINEVIDSPDVSGRITMANSPEYTRR